MGLCAIFDLLKGISMTTSGATRCTFGAIGSICNTPKYTLTVFGLVDGILKAKLNFLEIK